MKKLIAVVFFTALVTSKIYPQPFPENFEYSAGDTLAATGYWVSMAPLGVEYMKITSPGLTFPYYAGSGIGNAVTLDTVSPDGVYRSFNFPGINTGSVYASFMVSVFSARAAGDFFTAIGPPFFASGTRVPVFIRDSSGRIAFGIAKNFDAPLYTWAQYFRNTTYLLILKYTFIPGTFNDSLSLFVFSSPPPSTEPTPAIGSSEFPLSDMESAGRFYLFQSYSSSSLGVIVDGIYADYAWNNLVLPVELASFNANVNERDVLLNWSTVSELNNSGFEIERQDARGNMQDVWIKTGFIQGNGTVNYLSNYSFTDRSLSSGNYNYRLKQIDFNGAFKYFNLSNEVFIGIPAKFYLSQNYPNPFNPATKINYDIPGDGKVSLKIFDVSGKEAATLVNEIQTAGYYTVDFSGSNLSSGVYFYKIDAGDFTLTRKMFLIK